MKSAEQWASFLADMASFDGKENIDNTFILFRQVQEEAYAAGQEAMRQLAVEKLVWCNVNGRGLCDETPRMEVANLPIQPLPTEEK